MKLLTGTHKLIASEILLQFTISGVLTVLYMWDFAFCGVRLQFAIMIIASQPLPAQGPIIASQLSGPNCLIGIARVDSLMPFRLPCCDV